MTYKEHSGKGTVYSYTVVHRTRNKGFQEEVPYIVALIDLDGGGRMMSNIINTNPAEVRIGDKVRIRFSHVTDEVTLPHFVKIEK